jgi:hypothetical protein
MLGKHLDLTDDVPDRNKRSGNYVAPKSFVGVHFICCDVYTRIYINRDRSAYEGNCPKCAKPVRLRIGPGGTNARFFNAG